MKLSSRQKLALKVWFALTGILRFSQRIRSAGAWMIGLPPLAGADGAGDGGDGGEGGEGGDGGEGGEGGGEGGGSGFTPPDERTWSGVQQQLREAQQERDRLKAADEQRQREADEAAGNHKAIADRAEEARQAAERERDEARQEAENLKVERNVEKIAARLNFRDPGDVLHLLGEKDRADDAAIERRLKTVANERPYLTTAPENGHTREANGGDGGEGGGVEATGTDRLARAYAQSAAGKT